jgi:hypothetical protein
METIPAFAGTCFSEKSSLNKKIQIRIVSITNDLDPERDEEKPVPVKTGMGATFPLANSLSIIVV